MVKDATTECLIQVQELLEKEMEEYHAIYAQDIATIDKIQNDRRSFMFMRTGR
jgi:hypothetical protein